MPGATSGGTGVSPVSGMDARPGKSRSGAAGSAQLAYGVRGYPPCPGWVPPYGHTPPGPPIAIPPRDPPRTPPGTGPPGTPPGTKLCTFRGVFNNSPSRDKHGTQFWDRNLGQKWDKNGPPGTGPGTGGYRGVSGGPQIGPPQAGPPGYGGYPPIARPLRGHIYILYTRGL